MTSPGRGFEPSGPSRSTRRRRASGLTLVEVSFLVGLVGIVLAVAIPAFVRNVQVSKLAEASEQLEVMYLGVAAYYAATRATPEGLRNRCLPAGAGPTPAEPSATPVVVDFLESSSVDAPTWGAIGFAPATPLRFRYTFVPASTGCDRLLAATPGTPTVTLRAEGDLDGDGEYSRLQLTAEARDDELVRSRIETARDRTE